MSLSGCLFLILLILISGCSRTEYKPFGGVERQPVNFSRTVHFYLNPEFEKDPPKCVVVFQPYLTGNSDLLERVEKSLLRHLSEKFSSVVGGKLRDKRAANYAFDLKLPVDRTNFAKSIKCGSFLEFQVLLPKHTYMLVWSELKLGLEVRLFRQRDSVELWRASHVASRSDGGLSFSPLGLAVNAYDANVFFADPEIVDSVSEDLVRRLMASLPNNLNHNMERH
jgi:hypothetical protein